MSGFSGASLRQFLDLSTASTKSSNLSDGSLVSVTVNSSSSGQSNLTLGTSTGSNTLTVNQSLPEGAVLLGRAESTENGMRLRLLQAKNELQKVKTQELMKLLQGSGLDLSGRDVKSLKTTLVQQGHLSTEGGMSQSSTVSGSPTHSMAGTTLTVTEAPDSLNLPSSSEQPASVTVVSSEKNTATLQYKGETFSVRTPEKLDPGTLLQVTARRTDDGRMIQVESVRRRNLGNQQLNTVLKSLGLETSDENRSRLSRTVLANTNRSSGDLLNAVKTEFQLNTVPDRNEARDALETLMKRFRTSGSDTASTRSLTDLSREGLTQLLKEFGIEPDKSARETLRRVLSTDPNPSKTVAKTVMENIGLAKNQDGGLDQARLKTLLFLAKNDLPVKQELVDLLQFAAPDSDSTATKDLGALKQTLQGLSVNTGASGDSTETLNQSLANLSVPEFRPSGGNEGSEQLMRVLKQLGFDLERQVVNQPDRASDSLRSQLTQLQQTLSEVATEKIQQLVDSGNTELQQESRRVLSQLFKFSMSSVADDDSIYLFVPFPDGDETGLMRMRFQDESDGESIDDEQWSVTINLELSQLGSIRVGAQRHKQKLNLDFRARDKAALNLIRDRSEELSDVLSDRGFDVSVRTGVLREDQESLIDWNLYFDTDHYTGTLDVTV